MGVRAHRTYGTKTSRCDDVESGLFLGVQLKCPIQQALRYRRIEPSCVDCPGMHRQLIFSSNYVLVVRANVFLGSAVAVGATLSRPNVVRACCRSDVG